MRATKIIVPYFSGHSKLSILHFLKEDKMILSFIKVHRWVSIFAPIDFPWIENTSSGLEIESQLPMDNAFNVDKRKWITQYKMGYRKNVDCINNKPAQNKERERELFFHFNNPTQEVFCFLSSRLYRFVLFVCPFLLVVRLSRWR